MYGSNIIQPKIHITLLKCWRNVIDNFTDEVNKPILLLAGKKYEMYETLNNVSSELNIRKYVRFLGQVDDIFQDY